MSEFKTEQEGFWAGQFGKDYIGRNRSDQYLISNVAFFANIFRRTHDIGSVIELGANIGMNLRAIQALAPKAEVSGVEINDDAYTELASIKGVTAHKQSILDFASDRTYDFVFTKCVLIHIAPDYLADVYKTMHALSSRYVLMAEYYNPTPVEVTYREHTGKLFKRDFAGEFMERFTDFELVDYGFVWKRDPNFPQDDVSWFLMRKKA
ncbi:pseudaminic acid biosynthesis-associated methylase [Azospirillum sp. sgz301742]